ncbi:lytic transglycosylase domain-containing protein [Roseovarius sp. MBR-154]|jgi:hypothetical protein
MIGLLALPNAAAARPSHLCDRAAERAARAHGVPLEVLRAITRTETGRVHAGRMEPWPWTVNMAGEGRWFGDAVAARAYVDQAFRQGARSFDVGCFQINYKWHGAEFRSIAHMFDPEANASYAARFLKTLHDETGDWSVAAGYFHSRTPELAGRYRTRFERIRNALPDAGAARDAPEPRSVRLPVARQENSYPLFGGTPGSGGLASLVPLDNATRAPLIALGGS